MKMVKKLSIKGLFLIVGILLLGYSKTCYAKNIFESVHIGEVETSNRYFVSGETQYPLYNVKGYDFISLETLQSMQWNIEEVDGIYYIAPSNTLKSALEGQSVLNGNARMARNPVYCGNIRSYALESNGQLMFPIEVLKSVKNLRYDKGHYWLEENFQDELQLLKIDELGITNESEHLMNLTCVHLYWNGKCYEQTKESFILDVGERKNWELEKDLAKEYITTVVEEINEWVISEGKQGFYGQQNEVIFKQYSDSIYLGQLQTIFPRCIIKGQMNYGVGNLQAKQIVEVCRSEKHYYYVVKDDVGNKYQVPHGSVRILGEQGGVKAWNVSDEVIEDFATLSEIESATDYLIWTDLCRQRTYVLKKEDNRWKLEKRFVCSSGKENNPTPAGFYEVQYSIPYIGVQKGYRCKYALVFFRDYMFHSILFDKSGKYIKSGQYELGSKASHGCIRLAEKDSQWLYNHIPVKTKVWIR